MRSESGKIDEWVGVFKEQLVDHGYRLQTGTLVDSTVVQVPRQRNRREDNAMIKGGSVPCEWKDDPSPLRQKDTDARWVRKNGVHHYGDKNHGSVDRDTKLIANGEVTPANVHDSRVFGALLDSSPRGDPQGFADSAYRSEETVAALRKRGYKPRIHFKGYRGKPLPSRQMALNHSYSKVRCQVEHVFGTIRKGTNARWMNGIGRKRSRAWIGLVNLCYTMKRFAYLEQAEAA